MKTYFAIALAVLLGTAACEKDTDTKWNLIEGTVVPGSNLEAGDLGEVTLILGRILDGTDPAAINHEQDDFYIFDRTTALPDGSFVFDSLPDGNYVLACDEGFVFTGVDFEVFEMENASTRVIQKTVDRVPRDNGAVTYSIKGKNHTPFTISKIEFFIDESSAGSPDVTFSPKQSRKFDYTLDADLHPKFRVSVEIEAKTLVSDPLDFFFFSGGPDQLTFFKNKVSVNGQEVYLKLEKGWFFGHFFELSLHSSQQHGSRGFII